MRVLLRFPVARLGCRLVRGEVPDAALEVGPVSTWMEVHLASCLACQADVGSCDAAGEAILLEARIVAATHRPLELAVADGGLQGR